MSFYNLHFRQTPAKSDLLWEVDLVQQWWESVVFAEIITEAGCSGQEGRREQRRVQKSNYARADLSYSHFFCRNVPTDLTRQA